MSQNATDADVVMQITLSGPAYQILAECQFEEVREFATGLVAGVGVGVGAE